MYALPYALSWQAPIYNTIKLIHTTTQSSLFFGTSHRKKFYWNFADHFIAI